MYRPIVERDVGLIPINTVIRETRMQLEDAEWDGHPLASHYRHQLRSLLADADRGIRWANPNF